MNILHRQWEIRKDVLGLDEFHLYDQYNSLVPDCDKEYSFEEAKNLVLEALNVLGQDYVEILNKAFNERWIDVYNNKGKRTGAYSSGFYDTYPYILLNFEGKLRDVFTLTHELGHSVHTYLSCKNNPYNTSSYKIFVAEVASTVNEMLLNYYMLEHASTKEEKRAILSEMMDLFKSTIYRQTMFSEFEDFIFNEYENGNV